jgi:hypothetical protein
MLLTSLTSVRCRRSGVALDASTVQCTFSTIAKTAVDNIRSLQWQVEAFASLHITQGNSIST